MLTTDEAKGGKQAKQQFTVALCESAMERIENPHCFWKVDVTKLEI